MSEKALRKVTEVKGVANRATISIASGDGCLQTQKYCRGHAIVLWDSSYPVGEYYVR